MKIGNLEQEEMAFNHYSAAVQVNLENTDLMHALKLDPWDMDVLKWYLVVRAKKKVDIPYF